MNNPLFKLVPIIKGISIYITSHPDDKREKSCFQRRKSFWKKNKREKRGAKKSEIENLIFKHLFWIIFEMRDLWISPKKFNIFKNFLHWNIL